MPTGLFQATARVLKQNALAIAWLIGMFKSNSQDPWLAKGFGRLVVFLLKG